MDEIFFALTSFFLVSIPDTLNITAKTKFSSLFHPLFLPSTIYSLLSYILSTKLWRKQLFGKSQMDVE